MKMHKVTGVKRKKADSKGTSSTTPHPPLIATPRAYPRTLVDHPATVVPEVFDEMGASTDVHDATVEFVHMLDNNDVNIDQASINDYGYNEMDDGVHGHSEEDNVVHEIGEGVFDQAQAKVCMR
ncbi:putative galacturonosyltransferase 14 [Hordeum vulgare]|nr:putative galacturonosyltransferase 14 [Hordeum vulgare]